jgi:hypothetical protein
LRVTVQTGDGTPDFNAYTTTLYGSPFGNVPFCGLTVERVDGA